MKSEWTEDGVLQGPRRCWVPGALDRGGWNFQALRKAEVVNLIEFADFTSL